MKRSYLCAEAKRKEKTDLNISLQTLTPSLLSRSDNSPKAKLPIHAWKETTGQFFIFSKKETIFLPICFTRVLESDGDV